MPKKTDENVIQMCLAAAIFTRFAAVQRSIRACQLGTIP